MCNPCLSVLEEMAVSYVLNSHTAPGTNVRVGGSSPAGAPQSDRALPPPAERAAGPFPRRKRN
jgi:hypothetical protein